MRSNFLKMTKTRKTPVRKKVFSSPQDVESGIPCCEARERIEKKAYELYEYRGCAHGHDWEDWFEAERIVTTASEKE